MYFVRLRYIYMFFAVKVCVSVKKAPGLLHNVHVPVYIISVQVYGYSMSSGSIFPFFFVSRSAWN